MDGGSAVLERVRQALPGAVAFAPGQRGSGAYAVVIGLAAPVRFTRPGLGTADLAGWLVYAGSARGPGGIAARVGRHLRQGKAVKWHVDELTGAADWLGAVAVPDGDECAIVARLLAAGGFAIAMPGFGSSDCRICAGHLLQAG